MKFLYVFAVLFIFTSVPEWLLPFLFVLFTAYNIRKGWLEGMKNAKENQ